MFSVQEDLLKCNILFISSVISHVVKLLILNSIYFYYTLLIIFYQYSHNERNVRKNTCQFHIEIAHSWKD